MFFGLSRVCALPLGVAGRTYWPLLNTSILFLSKCLSVSCDNAYKFRYKTLTRTPYIMKTRQKLTLLEYIYNIDQYVRKLR